ncbi:unnamed protein product [Effrenium voratum]|nr:unnamed protein product [Effrenium voratum]
MLLPGKMDFSKFLEEIKAKHDFASFDSVVFDHEEHLFLPYLKKILAQNMLRVGGTVQVDNVRRKARALSSYLEFVHSRSNGFSTEILPVKEPYPDAVAISQFLGRGEL